MRLQKDEELGRYPAYAWPGGYPIIYVTADNSVLCPDCANGGNGCEASETSEYKQDRLVAMDVYWEGPVIQCDHCQGLIESAYGDPDEPEEIRDGKPI